MFLPSLNIVSTKVVSLLHMLANWFRPSRPELPPEVRDYEEYRRKAAEYIASEVAKMPYEVACYPSKVKYLSPEQERSTPMKNSFPQVMTSRSDEVVAAVSEEDGTVLLITSQGFVFRATIFEDRIECAELRVVTDAERAQ